MPDLLTEQQTRLLRQQVDRARQRLDDLRQAARRAQRAADHSMRTRTVCPACSCQELIHARQVLDRAETFIRSPMALVQPRLLNLTGAGQFEAWICTACGLVEWYVPDLSQVPVDGELRVHVGGEEPTEPGPVQEPTQPAQHQLQAIVNQLDQLLPGLLNRGGALDRSMRTQARCPLCGGQQLLYARQVLDRADGPTRAPMALEQLSWFNSENCAGRFEAWICRGCGAVEWYVPDLSRLTMGPHQRLVPGPAPRHAPPTTMQDQLAGDLEADLSEVLLRLEALQTVVAAATTQPASWLSRQHVCPACGGHEVLHASEVLDRSEAGKNRMALVQPWLLRLRGAGKFEAWICAGCGLVEWRIPEIEQVKPDGKKLVLVRGPDQQSGAPYR